MSDRAERRRRRAGEKRERKERETEPITSRERGVGIRYSEGGLRVRTGLKKGLHSEEDGDVEDAPA